jgi:Zn-dependent peptidase ImmA (M78 family)
MSAALQFNPDVLESAALRIGKSLELMAKWLSTAPKTQEKITRGTLSIAQAEKFAKETRVPFGFLFLDTLPTQKQIYIPDLRQTESPEKLSDNFFDTLEDINKKQEWYIDYLKDIGALPLPFVDSFNKTADATAVAISIRKTLGFPIDRTQLRTKEDYFNVLAQRCESQGILIFRNGIVKNATNRGLPVSEFRGFVLPDKLAPAIFVNGKDAPAAWIFTLAHELAHLWLGIRGVTDVAEKAHDHIEILCNKIAAEILIPASEFLPKWDEFKSEIPKLAKFFLVSELAIARVALTHKKIELADYIQIYEKMKKDLANKKENEPGGGVFLTNIPIRNSRKFTRAVVNQAIEGKLLLRDAGRLLNVSPQHILDLNKKMAA